MNISVHLSGIKPRSEIPGSYGNCKFNFIRNSQTVFQSGYTVSYLHQPFMSDSVSPHTCQHSVFNFFKVILIGV